MCIHTYLEATLFSLVLSQQALQGMRYSDLNYSPPLVLRDAMRPKNFKKGGK